MTGKDVSDKGSQGSDDEIFSDRGAPALISPREPAIRTLRERYGESFAFVPSKNDLMVHLFMIKVGLWALVYTFVPKDLTNNGQNGSPLSIRLADALDLAENALRGNDESLLSKLDQSVSKAKSRIKGKADQFSRARDSSMRLD